MASYENEYIKIHGRNSVDIIKTGGYKVSAIEIEEVLRRNESIDDCAVVGIMDEEWGEVVTAFIISKDGFEKEGLKTWLKDKLAPYKMPKHYIELDELPKNALGKVVKPELKKYQLSS